MKNLFFLIPVVTLIVGCGYLEETSPSNQFESNYFEGEIIYSIEYDSLPSYITSDYLKNSIAAKTKFVFKNGNHRKEFYNSKGQLISQRILDLENGISYSKNISEDTVFWIDISKNDSRSVFTVKDDTIIDNYECKSLLVEVTTPNPKVEGERFDIVGEYFYAKELTFNPKWFAKYKEGDYNLIAAETKSLLIGKKEQGPFWNTSFTCDTVIWRKVDDAELSPGFLKKYPKVEL